MNAVKSRIEDLEDLLKSMIEAATNLLMASNGLSDNEWRVGKQKWIPMWPVGGYGESLDRLDKSRMAAEAFLNPAEEERMARWLEACTLSSFIVDRYVADSTTGEWNPKSGLHRNIADAIYGTLKYSPADSRAGFRPTTMRDQLAALVKDGKLVQIDPKPEDEEPSP